MAAGGYVFDAYGTLFDVHAAMRSKAGAVGPQWEAVSALWRAKQLEYCWVRSLMGSYSDFWRLTELALDYALETYDIKDAALRERLLETYWTLPAYPEVTTVLTTLKARSVRVAVLSNGSPDMLSAAIGSAHIEQLVDDIFSVDAIKIYKTAPETYRMVTDAWDDKPARVTFVSSNRWDIAGATKFGFSTIWLNRSGSADEYPNYPPGRIIASLDDLTGP